MQTAKTAIKTKRTARIYMGVLAGAACFAGLACFFTARPTLEAGSITNFTSLTEPNTHETTGIPTDNNQSAADTPTHGKPPDQSALTPPADETDIPDNDTDAEKPAENPNPTPEEIAILKEKHIRERFGVIRRDGKWIPTAGGGTNLVYITTGSLPPGRVDEIYDIQFQATSGFPPYQWSIADEQLPGSLALDGRSGRLSGISPEPAVIRFFLQVADSKGARDIAEYILAIQPEQPLEIVTESLPGAFPGELFSCQLQAVGGIPPYVWSMEGDVDGIGSLVIDQYTGQIYGEISAASPPADIPLTLWLSDEQLVISQDIVLHIRTELGILDLPQSSIRQAEKFEFAFKAAGGLEPYTWGAASYLPPGLELSATGICSGEPLEPGTYDISIWVQDAADQVDTVQFTLEVLPELPLAISDFEAFLSLNSAALKWELPPTYNDLSVRIVRNSSTRPVTPSDGITIYTGQDNSYIDRDVGAGNHYYTAFLEKSGSIVTTAPPPVISVTLPYQTDPFADRVVATHLLHPDAYGSGQLPGVVLGAPTGQGIMRGSANVLSLGAATDNENGASAPYGGMIILEFTDNVAWNGPGPDFTIFENVFYILCTETGIPDPETRYMEPAVVAVSQDGVDWRQFKFNFSPRYHPETGELNLRHPYCYNTGFAGINPVMSNGLDPDPTDPTVSGGDSFDLAEVGLDWIRYIRIQSTGNRWLVDDDGDLVWHTEEMNAASHNSTTAGFDLDAVTAIWTEKVTTEGR